MWQGNNPFNPLTPKFNFLEAGIEHVVHLPMSPWPCVHSTEVRLHRASVHGWAPGFDPVNDINGYHGGVAGGVRTVDTPNLPDNSSSDWRREKVFLKCDTWSTSYLGFFWWGRLPTIHQGRFRPSTNLKNLLAARGRCPLQPPHLNGGCPPQLFIGGSPVRKTGQGPNKKKMRLKAISLPA